MYILGIDFGTKKLGLAILESSSGITSPLPIVRNDDYLFNHLQKILKDYNISNIVIGLPSYENTQKKVTAFTEKLKLIFAGTVSFTSEDNTSITVKKELTSHKQKQNLDSFSAIAILEQWATTNLK